jgi:hypothetical protein
MLIAVAALALGAARMWALRSSYLARAAYHDAWRRQILATPGSIAYWESRWQAQREGLPASPPRPAGPPFALAKADYHTTMRDKWRRAAARPWLPVEPDPIPY